MRRQTALPTLLLLALALFLFFAPSDAPQHRAPARRAGILGLGDDPSSAAPSASASSPTSTPTSSPTSAPPSSTDTPTSTPTSSPTSSPTSAAPSSTPTSTPASTPASTPTSAAPSTPPPTSSAPVSTITTMVGNSQVVVFITDSGTATASSATSSASSGASNSNDDDDKGVSTSTIVGLSVAGGVALLGIVGFFVWKFTRKRFHDLDDNEAIKWPELNTHDGVPASAHPFTDASTTNLHAPGSDAHYAHSIGATSTTELFAQGGDPYAVPPLPQFNPAQGAPYRDDPHFYDPYGGPVPPTLGPERAGTPGSEAIPMTQLAGRRSPGPGQGFAMGMDGRASPALPGGMYGERARSPAPAMMGQGGRASPAPGAGGYGGGAYGGGGGY